MLAGWVCLDGGILFFFSSSLPLRGAGALRSRYRTFGVGRGGGGRVSPWLRCNELNQDRPVAEGPVLAVSGGGGWRVLSVGIGVGVGRVSAGT